MSFEDVIKKLRELLPGVEGDNFNWNDVVAILAKQYKDNEVDKGSALQITDSEGTPAPLSKTDGFFPTLTVNEVFEIERVQLSARVWLNNLSDASALPSARGRFETSSFCVRRRPPLNSSKNPSIQITGGPAALRERLGAGDVFVFIRTKGDPQFCAFGIRKNDAALAKLDVESHMMWVSPDTAKRGKEIEYKFEHLVEGCKSDQLSDAFISELLQDLRLRRNIILEGVPGTGKSHCIGDLVEIYGPEQVSIIVMHPAIGYEDLMEGVRPSAGGAASGAQLFVLSGSRAYHECYGEPRTAQQGDGPAFSVRGGMFLLACAQACRHPSKRFLIVLDEINRCNVPRAFGELLLALEPSKRWRWDSQSSSWQGGVPVRLPYSGLDFFVPDNVDVLATMNTSDRSVAPLDHALRRRFAFKRLEPMSVASLKCKLLSSSDQLFAEAIEAWHQLNNELAEQFGADLMLGHSYLFEADHLVSQGSTVRSALRVVWKDSILPQILESLHAVDQSEFTGLDLLSPFLKKLDLVVVRAHVSGSYAISRIGEVGRDSGGG
jgi:hypothetical protein